MIPKRNNLKERRNARTLMQRRCPVCFAERRKFCNQGRYPIYECLVCTHVFAGDVALASQYGEEARRLSFVYESGAAKTDEFRRGTSEHLCVWKSKAGTSF